ncbi:ATP-binding protein [Demequina sp. SYSU T00039]|uniref:Sensor-like histidine kinase SenX3 n=1 Tax=Demequina lignilytica TaxID=3051663 RepID=A0AAW7M9P1_9MICO|nr:MULTISPECIES: ATP-binding protein [unclassified Demequina]MDN4477483.1 ATP-binding protein [Demequina sp. SYSU T00039-1]MDN4488166.1 ATP-binding protein [Demequina sp. SYSU T00039]MDN4490607.1 ATP-binding protein [Demequina sp. SYSU T00068]
MTPDLWLAAAVGALVGAAVVALLGLRRRHRLTVAATLVPHRTRQLMSILQSGAVVVRRDRRSAFANSPAVALGIARLDGKLHSDVADLAEEAWRRDEPVEDEVAVQRGVLGSTSFVHVRVTPLDDELCLAVANDHTEARAAEQSRREFAVNVSHELKTPIGALSLLAETIEEGADDPVMVRKFAKKMRKEARRLTKLIQEIIEITRLQGGGSIAEHERLQLDGVVHEAIEAARLGADARDIRIVPDLKARPEIMGDRDLLVMALRNLIDNAVQYSDPGREVAVALGAKDGVASISVVDHGIGIDPKDQERIFERFYRADPARSRDTGGTGLGLSIVKHVALQHAGSVGLWSEQGVGSTFTLKLNVLQEG